MYNRFGRELCQEQNSGEATKKLYTDGPCAAVP